MEKKTWIMILVVIAIIIVAYIIFSILSTGKCSDFKCFYSKMAGCKKSSFINEAEEASWLYTVKDGKGGLFCFLSNNLCNECIVNVKMLQAKKGALKIDKLQGLDMDCTLLMGYAADPQADLTKCHGLLKEGFQELMINKMYSYIVTNIGKISEDLQRAI